MAHAGNGSPPACRACGRCTKTMFCKYCVYRGLISWSPAGYDRFLARVGQEQQQRQCSMATIYHGMVEGNGALAHSDTPLDLLASAGETLREKAELLQRKLCATALLKAELEGLIEAQRERNDVLSRQALLRANIARLKREQAETVAAIVDGKAVIARSKRTLKESGINVHTGRVNVYVRTAQQRLQNWDNPSRTDAMAKPLRDLRAARCEGVVHLASMFALAESSIGGLPLPDDLAHGLEHDAPRVVAALARLHVFAVAVGRVLGTTWIAAPFHPLEARLLDGDGAARTPTPQEAIRDTVLVLVELVFGIAYADGFDPRPLLPQNYQLAACVVPVLRAFVDPERNRALGSGVALENKTAQIIESEDTFVLIGQE